MSRMRQIEIEVSGQRHIAMAAQGKGVLWLHLNGETYTIETEKKSTRRGKSSGSASRPGEVLAPMPGKIIKSLVKPGDKVKTQQVLIVMEAMKMEYTLKAHADGTVAEVSVQAGEQVTLGQLLARVELL